MAATSEGSSAVAGVHQLGLLSFSIMQPISKMAAQIKAYRDAFASPESRPLADTSTNRVAAYTIVHCAETMDQAVTNGIWDSIAWWYQTVSEFILKYEMPELPVEEREKAFPLLKPLWEGNIPIEQFDEGDMVIVGDPDRCVEKMKRYADLGVDQLICYVQFGQLSGESTLRTVELLGKEIIPELEKYVPVDVGASLLQAMAG
jgi:alkanesulfonate monooxygenase SsuD/methylene tetrahydromethanopterin reductase-like flavin-dependent oxidoreductase (luciferase family)